MYLGISIDLVTTTYRTNWTPDINNTKVTLQFRSNSLLDDRIYQRANTTSDPYSHIVTMFYIDRGLPNKTYAFRRACHDD
jgi:hypothetical protein